MAAALSAALTYGRAAQAQQWPLPCAPSHGALAAHCVAAAHPKLQRRDQRSKTPPHHRCTYQR
eukprot:5240892-Prymnesium_polylepis.1